MTKLYLSQYPVIGLLYTPYTGCSVQVGWTDRRTDGRHYDNMTTISFGQFWARDKMFVFKTSIIISRIMQVSCCRFNKLALPHTFYWKNLWKTWKHAATYKILYQYLNSFLMFCVVIAAIFLRISLIKSWHNQHLL